MSNTQCPTCLGSGTLDSEGKPWQETTRKPNARVRSGELFPVSCRDCAGTGSTEKRDPSKPVSAPDMHSQIASPEPAQSQPAAETPPAKQKAVAGILSAASPNP